MAIPVVIGYSRTAIGAMQGDLASFSATDLGAQAIAGAISKTDLSSLKSTEILMGCVLSAGLGQSPARQALIKAGLANNIPATTVNKVCGSGMKAVTLACTGITCDPEQIVIAGGMESMSNAPYMLNKARQGYRLGHDKLMDHMFFDGLQDAYSGELMGVYAEATAKKYGFSRGDQDNFTLESLEKAIKAIANGSFQDEITPISVKSRKGEIIVDTDELPGKARPEKIAKLKPAFQDDGTVTAANSSGISDGAAALIMTSKALAEKSGYPILAEIKGYTQHAHQPEWFTTAPVGAIKTLLNKLDWNVDEVDLFEINEAFAVVTMAAIIDLEIPAEKVNVHGGACALGHPIGASGARILVTLISALKQKGLKKGIASLCIGGGEGIAVAVEC